MKRKELAKFVDKMSDHIDEIMLEPTVKAHGSGAYAKAVKAAQPTEDDVYCVKAGAIAALVAVYDLLTDKEELTDPEGYAEEMMINTIGCLIQHRIRWALKDGADD